MSKSNIVLIAVMLLTFVSVASVQGQVSYEIVALKGDPIPDGNGSYSSFESPVLNDRGEAAFVANLTVTGSGGEDSRGIFRGDGKRSLAKIARRGEAAPDGNGEFFSFRDPVLNNAGQVAFESGLDNTNGGSSGIFLGDGTSIPVQIARRDEVAPDGNGIFSDLAYHQLNDAGQVLFRSFLEETTGGRGRDDSVIYRSEGIGGPTKIVRKGDPTADGDTFFSGSRDLDLNANGQVAFLGFSSSSPGSASFSSGIFRGDGTSTPVKIARSGDAAPDGNGVFRAFFISRSGYAVALNDSGAVAFRGSVYDTEGGDRERIGIFRGDGTSSPVKIALAGDTAPDGNGSFASFGSPTGYLALNNSGQVAFSAILSGRIGEFNNFASLFLGDGENSLTQIAQAGQLAPDGNGIFIDLADPVLNDAGQAAFLGRLANTIGDNSDNAGLYIYDGSRGLIQLARNGDELLGSTIRSVDFTDARNGGAIGGSGLNDRGQVAFRFTLADGRQGIAIATIVPEPSAMLLGGIAGGALLLLRTNSRTATRSDEPGGRCASG